MKLSTNTVADIVKAIEQTAERLAQTTDEAVLTDLYIRVNPADGVLTICDDDDRQLAKTICCTRMHPPPFAMQNSRRHAVP